MNKTLSQLNEYLRAAHGLLNHYGPTLWASTLELVRLHAIFDLSINVGLFAAAVFLSAVAIPFIYRTAEDRAKHNYGLWDMVAIIEMCVATVFFLVCFMGAVGGWCMSLPDWLGLFDPRLAVLYSIAHKFGVIGS